MEREPVSLADFYSRGEVCRIPPIFKCGKKNVKINDVVFGEAVIGINDKVRRFIFGNLGVDVDEKRSGEHDVIFDGKINARVVYRISRMRFSELPYTIVGGFSMRDACLGQGEWSDCLPNYSPDDDAYFVEFIGFVTKVPN